VIVTVDAEASVMENLESHAAEGLSRFAEFPGFISGALHRSADGKRLVNYLQWESEAAHLACMNDPRWENEPSARRFMDMMMSGEAKVDVRTYVVLRAMRAGR